MCIRDSGEGCRVEPPGWAGGEEPMGRGAPAPRVPLHLQLARRSPSERALGQTGSFHKPRGREA
eukprot:10015198-Alexandrium_andersonii.AAC.1